MLKVIWAKKTASSEPELETLQLIGLALLDEQETPPVQTQFENCQPVEGEGRLAVAEKPLPHPVELSPLVKVPLQALIEPGEEAPRKLVGFVLKVTAGGTLLSVKTIWPLLFEEQEPASKLRLLVSPVYPAFTHDGTITFPLSSVKAFTTVIVVPELKFASEPPP